MFHRIFPRSSVDLADARHREELGRARTLTPGELELPPLSEEPAITRMGYQLRDLSRRSSGR